MPAKRVHRILLAALASALVAGAGAGSARAATINVSPAGVDNAGCGEPGTPCQTLGHVLVNRVTPAPDTIALAPGEFAGPGLVVSNPNASGDTIQGSGSQFPGGTVLKHGNVGDNAQLFLNVVMTVRSLSIRVPAGASVARRGLGMSNTAGASRVEDVAVVVENGSTAPSVVTNAGSSGVVFDRLRVSGNHVNDALGLQGVSGNVVPDSVLQGGSAAVANAMSMDGSEVVVRRSRLFRDFAAPGLDPVVEAISSQLTVESSLITGGRVGFNSQAVPPASASLTLRGVTIDVASPGVSDLPPDRHPIYVRTTMPGAASSTARVERSVFLEPIYTFVEAGSTVKVDCFDSILTPPQESATTACGAANGNTAATAAETFVNPFAGDYHLKPGSPAVDGAASELSANESPTDLEGNPRLLDGNRDCLARIDRGAYELTGQAADPATCQPVQPPVGKPPVGNPPAIDPPPVLDRVSLSPRRFRAKGAKRGTRVRFRLSEAAKVTMTIERVLAGRRQGNACRAPSRRNRRAKKCARYLKVGALAYSAKKGSSSIAFSGRLGRRTLTPGGYRARLRARDKSGKKSAERRVAFRVLR